MTGSEIRIWYRWLKSNLTLVINEKEKQPKNKIVSNFNEFQKFFKTVNSFWVLPFFTSDGMGRILIKKKVQKQSLEVFYENGVLINFAKLTGKHLWQSLSFNKVTCLSLWPTGRVGPNTLRWDQGPRTLEWEPKLGP